MERKLDELLKHALTPMEEPDPRLNQGILAQYITHREASDRDALRRNVPDRVALDRATLDQYVPGQVALDQYAPGRVAPDQYTPGQAAPDQYAPDRAAPSRKGQKRTGTVQERKKTPIIMNVCRSTQTGGDMTGKIQTAGKENGRTIKTRRIPAAILTAALIIGAGSFTAIAAYKYLAPDRVAQKAGDGALAEAFSTDKGIPVNESQTWGGYRVTLLGIASGDDLSDRIRTSDTIVISDRTYAVVAIEHEDGSPLTEASEEEFFVSPLIGGYHPAFYNAASMHGNYTEVLDEGILYRLVECDNVAIFADRDLYLSVSDGSVFYSSDAYCYDRETGRISRNEEYPGLNALFSLPIDTAKADPEKAEAYILGLGITVPDIPEEKMNVELEDDFVVEGVEENKKGAQAAEYALQFTGNPYVWGGESLTEGCDCSGFTKEVFAHFAVSLPHRTAGQKEYGEEVQGLEKACPGDLIFYENPSHVGIYIGEGNIVHADPAFGICISEADYSEIVMIRRILQ